MLLVAFKESSLLGGKPKLKYQCKLPLARLEVSDSKQAYVQTPSKVASIHPIRSVVDQTGSNPEVMFHLRLYPAPEGKASDPLLESVKSSKDLSIEDSPVSISLAVVATTVDQRRKWVEKINEEQKVVLGKDKARADAIKKVHGKKTCSCCIIL